MSCTASLGSFSPRRLEHLTWDATVTVVAPRDLDSDSRRQGSVYCQPNALCIRGRTRRSGSPTAPRTQSPTAERSTTNPNQRTIEPPPIPASHGRRGHGRRAPSRFRLPVRTGKVFPRRTPRSPGSDRSHMMAGAAGHPRKTERSAGSLRRRDRSSRRHSHPRRLRRRTTR